MFIYGDRALSLKEKAVGPDHLEIIEVLNSYGVMQMMKGNFVEAEDIFARVLRIVESKLSIDNNAAIKPLANRASVYMGKGDLNIARTDLKRVLEINLRAISGDVLIRSMLIANMAMIEQRMGRLR